MKYDKVVVQLVKQSFNLSKNDNEEFVTPKFLNDITPDAFKGNKLVSDKSYYKKKSKELLRQIQIADDECNLSYRLRNSDSGPFDVSFNHPNVDITFKISKGMPNTFKFFGMDITEDLDVVVKGSEYVVKVASIADVIKQTIEAYKYSEVISGYLCREDVIRYILEYFKTLSNFNDVPSIANDLEKIVGEKKLEKVIEDSEASNGFILNSESVVISLLSNDLEESEVNLNIDGEYRHYKYSLSKVLPYLIEAFYRLAYSHKRYALLLEIIEQCQALLAEVYGDSASYKVIKGNSSLISDVSSIGFKGFKGFKGDSILDKYTVLSQGDKYLHSLNYSIRRNHSTIHDDFVNEDVLMTMVSSDNPDELYDMSQDELRTRILLDIMKYKDEDLIFNDFGDIDEELLGKHIIRTLRRNSRLLDNYGIDVDTALDIVSDKEKRAEILDIVKGSSDYIAKVTGDVNDVSVSNNIAAVNKSKKLIEKICKKYLLLFDV